MLSWRNARAPPAITVTNSASISNRCLSAKAISAFMESRLACRPRRASTGACGPVDEQAAARDHALACLDAFEDLDHAAIGEAGLDLAQLDRLVLMRHPDAHRAAFIDERLARDSDAGEILLGEDADIGIHLRLEEGAGIVDRRANQEPPARRVERGRHIIEPGLEDMVGIGQHRELEILADAHPPGLGLAHIGGEPTGREAADPANRVAGAPVYILAGSALCMPDRPGNRREDRRLGADAA